MIEQIIGRKEEQSILQRIFDSKRSEFVAIYGRRRVGKTYLVRRFFANKDCHFFQVTGVKDATIKEQLGEFTRAVEKTFYQPGEELKNPPTWMKALDILSVAMEKFKNGHFIIFFDEIPWLATKRARFLQALDYYWNTKWSDNPKIKLIICGSAASWVIENIINNKGGLHNRVTAQIRLEPFTLAETKLFLKYRNIELNDRQNLLVYMTMGGVPHYLNQLTSGLSATQNIDKICFTKNGILFNEFKKLFSSLFSDPELHIELIRRIAKKRHGIERTKLLKEMKMTSGGRFNKRIQELEEAGFISSFLPYNNENRGIFYKVTDEYTLFYLNWIEPNTRNIRHQKNSNGYWSELSQSASWDSWSGLAFEAVCFKHIAQIRHTLSITITAQIGAWSYIPKKGSAEQGAQIDLLFDRNDDSITICEIKYTEKLFLIDKQYKSNLENKIAVFKTQTNTQKQIFLAMVASAGIKQNMHSDGFVANQVTMNDLMQE